MKRIAISLVVVALSAACTSPEAVVVELPLPEGGTITIAYPSDLDMDSSGVTVSKSPVQDGPDVRIDGSSGSLLVFVDDCDRMKRLDEERYGAEVFAFCDVSSDTLFFVAGSAAVQQEIHESLVVNP